MSRLRSPPIMAPGAYEVKNNYCLFLRLFEIKMNGVFLFEISSFVMEILRFL